MDRPTAFTLLSLQCAQTSDPVLPDEVLNALLDAQEANGFTTWVASRPHDFGDLVIPTVRNGKQYRCIVAGTSGATEPFWPLYSQPDSAVGISKPFWHGFTGTYMGSTVSDGTTIVWQEAGPDDRGNVYNLRKATRDAWLQKAAIASARIAVGDSDERLARDQVIDHCMMMAKAFQPTGFY